ncbi:50S ribosomal protein L28 [bacterium]
MAQKCAICDKKPKSGNSITHSHRAIKRKFKPNLQKINIVLSGRKQKTYVCTSCIKAGKISKA